MWLSTCTSAVVAAMRVDHTSAGITPSQLFTNSEALQSQGGRMTKLGRTAIRHPRWAVLLLAVIGSTARVTGQSAAVTPPPVHLSLEYLVANSSGVFVGHARHTKTLTDQDRIGGLLPTQQIRFKVIECLAIAKVAGCTQPEVGNTQQEVKLSLLDNPRVSKDERVLWFVRTSAGAAMEGPFSRAADFRVVSEPTPPDAARHELSETGPTPATLVMNFEGNKGLWSESKPLWDAKSFPRDRAAAYLTTYLRKRLEPSDTTPKGIEAIVEQILSIGDKGYRAQPVPLELILAASSARLATR